MRFGKCYIILKYTNTYFAKKVKCIRFTFPDKGIGNNRTILILRTEICLRIEYRLILALTPEGKIK